MASAETKAAAVGKAAGASSPRAASTGAVPPRLSPRAVPDGSAADPAADDAPSIGPVPDWVPELNPHTHADVYPVLDEPAVASHPHALRISPELELDRAGVSSGYAERRQPWEFASCLPPPPPASASASSSAAAAGAGVNVQGGGVGGMGDLGGTNGSSAAASPLHPAVSASPPAPHSMLAPSASPPTTPAADSAGAAAAAQSVAGVHIISSEKLRRVVASVAALRKARPVTPQRQVLTPSPAPDTATAPVAPTKPRAHGKTRPFPLQKTTQPLDAFLKKLSSGEYTTAQLAQTVPIVPGVMRSVGRLLEAMANHEVPAQRATWFIRVAVLNELHKQARPDRPAPSPRQSWTRAFCEFMKNECDHIRSRRLATLAAARDRALFWDYVLQLARWQADEGLLDSATWVSRIQYELRKELAIAQSHLRETPATMSMVKPEELEILLLGCRIVLGAAERFEPEILQGRESARSMVDSLISMLGPLTTSGRSSVSGRSSINMTSSAAVAQAQALASSIRAGIIARLGSLLYKGMKRLFTGDENEPLRAVSLSNRSIPTPSEPPVITQDMSLEELVDRSSSMLGLSRRRPVSSDSPAPTSSPMSVSSFGSLLTAIPSLPNLPGELVAGFALQKFPMSGDPTTLKDILLGELGSASAAAHFICRWAVEGSFSLSVLTPLTAATAMRALEDPVATTTARQNIPVPQFHREILSYMSSTEASADNVALMVAHMCLAGSFSMSLYMRDISRLTSSNPRHLEYLEKLPEPADRTAASQRRSILRRRRGSMNTKDSAVVDDAFIEAALKGDVRTAAIAGASVNSRSLSECLSIADAVCNVEAAEMHGRLASAVAFLEAAGSLWSAVRLVLRRLGEICRSQTLNSAQVRDASSGFQAIVRMATAMAAAGALPETIGILNEFLRRTGLPDTVVNAVDRAITSTTESFSGTCPSWNTWVKTLGVGPKEGRSHNGIWTSAQHDAGNSLAPEVIALRERLVRQTRSRNMEQTKATVAMEPNEVIGVALIPVLRRNFCDSTALKVLDEVPLCYSLYSVRASTALSLVNEVASSVKSNDVEAAEAWGRVKGLLVSSWLRDACLMDPSVVSAAKLGEDVDMTATIVQEMLRGHPGSPWVSAEQNMPTDAALIMNCTNVFNASIAELHLTVLVAQRREKDGIEELCAALSGDAVRAAQSVEVASILGRMVPSVCDDSSDSSVKALAAGYLARSATTAMAESFVGLIGAARQTHLEDHEKFANTDSSLRALVKASLPIARPMDRDAVGQSVLDQLRSAATALSDSGAEELLSHCDTETISAALTERLNFLLFTVVGVDSSGSGASLLVDVLISTAPLLDQAGISTLLTALKVVLGPKKRSPNDAESHRAGQESKESMLKRVRESGVECWLPPKTVSRLETILGTASEAFGYRRKPVVAFTSGEDGTAAAVDPWLLLEGYGARPDEDPAIPPEAFGLQGDPIDPDLTAPIVRLKRTYSTFACLVR